MIKIGCETTKSIAGKIVAGSERKLGFCLIQKWEFPCLEINRKTDCFEPTGETYFSWGATIDIDGGSRTEYFLTLVEAEVFALTKE